MVDPTQAMNPGLDNDNGSGIWGCLEGLEGAALKDLDRQTQPSGSRWLPLIASHATGPSGPAGPALASSLCHVPAGPRGSPLTRIRN